VESRGREMSAVESRYIVTASKDVNVDISVCVCVSK
jgi:hypothetical protein